MRVNGYGRPELDTEVGDGEIGEDAKSCLPGDDEMKGWPGAFYDKLRQAQSEGTAW